MRNSIRPFAEHDATEGFSMLDATEELHVGGFTYSKKAVQNWHANRAQDVILIAELRKQTAGFIASKMNDPEPGAAYIDCLVVNPEYRMQQVGQRLLNRCLSALKGHGIFFVYLHVRPEFPRAISFWEKSKFKGKQPLLWMCKEI